MSPGVSESRAGSERSSRYLRRGSRRKGDLREPRYRAGPIKTLAASGIDNLRYIVTCAGTSTIRRALRRTVTIEEVEGQRQFYLLSPMSRGVTGEILHVDPGYHVIGMKNPLAPDIHGSPRSEPTAPPDRSGVDGEAPESETGQTPPDSCSSIAWGRSRLRRRWLPWRCARFGPSAE